MPKIKLETYINSSIEICFDLSRSIDLHELSTKQTNEKAVAGRTTGLIELNECVTWEAMHFGIKQRLTTKITDFQRPYFFTDEQVSGAFRSFRHRHCFEQIAGQVRMTDFFDYEAPLGIVGQLFSNLVLTRYMTRLLSERNKVIKEIAETGALAPYLRPTAL